MNNYKEVTEIANSLKGDFRKLSDFEALTIAAQIQTTNVLEASFQTGYSNQPPFLEAIAIALGYKLEGSTVIDVI